VGGLSIGKVKGIGDLTFLPSLIFDRIAAPDGRGLATVKVDAGEIELGLVPVQELYPTVLPSSR